MKTMKRMMAVLVVLAMLMTMVCTSAYAETVDITIDGAKIGHTYKLYKLMDLIYDASAETYAYTPAEKWQVFFETGKGSDFASLDGSNQVNWKVEAIEAQAKALAAAALEEGIAADKEDTASGTTLTFAGVDPGYYVMESSAGTFLTIESIYSENITLKEKNNLPNINKTVKNASVGTADYAETAEAEIGNEVSYQIVVAVADGAKAYAVEDTLPAGITLNADSVVLSGNGITAADYTVTYEADGFTVDVEDAYLAKLSAANEFTITYTGTVTSDVRTGTEGNVNTAVLTVSDVKADEDTAKVLSYEMIVKKVIAGTQTPLKDAKFKLYNSADQYISIDAESGAVSWGAEDTAATFTTAADGTFIVKGLMSGEYYLKETAAPAGYKLLSDDVDAVITDDNIEVTVENSKATILPETGGMGTALFYGFGIVLMAGAAVLLVSRKRREN